MALQIRKAVKEQAKMRLALAGPPGAGKTWTGLTFATVFAEGGKILVIDSEHGRSTKYADYFEFDIIELDTFSPKVYLEALALAFREGYAAVLIDSLSHAWNGEGGALEMVDQIARARANGREGNKFNAWGDVTPLQNQLMNAIQRAPFHVIATMRSKTEYVQEVGANGRTAIRKLGVAPIQREGVDYEFDVYGMMDREHQLTIEKSVCRTVPVGKPYFEPDASIAQTLLDWLKNGKAAEPVAKEATTNEMPDTGPTETMASDRQIISILKLCAALGRQEPEVATLTFAAAKELLIGLTQTYTESRADTTERPATESAKVQGERWIAAEGISEDSRKNFAKRHDLARTWEAFMGAINTTEGACELRVINWSKRNRLFLVNVEAYMKRENLRTWADMWDQIEQNPDDQLNAIREM